MNPTEFLKISSLHVSSANAADTFYFTFTIRCLFLGLLSDLFAKMLLSLEDASLGSKGW